MAVPIFTLTLILVAAGAHADDYECEGRCVFGPEFQLDGNLIIKEGAVAILNGSTIDGNIILEDGAELKAKRIFVGGNIQSQGSDDVYVKKSFIDGDVQLDNNDGTIDILKSEIGGSIQLFNNDATNKKIRVKRNEVDADVQLFDNTAGKIFVSRNVIGGNLQGESNDPNPTGKGNDVEGDTDGDFEGF